ncbi:hypothetical protein Tco_0217369, partial [Tanacetum coccineum]
MASDVSWKSKLSTLNEENVLLKTQVDYVVKERENIKLEYQKLFNSIKATRTQHQKELDELIEHVNQKTYSYADTSETLLGVTPLPKNIAVKAKKVSNTKVNADRITKTKTQMLDSKSNINVSNSTGVESSNSVKRPKSKDNKSNNRVLKNTNDKRPCAHVRKMSSSVSIDSNKRETMHSNVYQSNISVLNTKIVNAVNDSSNIICVSYGKDVFLLSHEICVARYALSRDSKVKRALFTTPIATKSKNLGATSVVVKSRLSVAKTPTATNKVSSDPARTVRFGNDHFAAITGYGDYVQGNLTIFHNRSIVHTRYNKTPYELIHGRKPNVQYFHVFGSLCYPTNDHDDLRKIKPKADI